MPTFDACSSCGKQVYRTRTSRAEITCRECRRKQPRVPSRPLRPCAWCGQMFQPKPKARYRPPQAFCSKSCAATAGNIARGGTPGGKRRNWADLTEAARQRKRMKARARRLGHLATWDGVTDEAILDRDRWMCGICGKRIGRTFRYPHARSKSIDHVIPLSEGGDDTAANKRAAHLGCNMARGNHGGGEQLALIG